MDHDRDAHEEGSSREPARRDDDGGPPDLRVGDADRQSALEALGVHLQAGRLDIDEYGDRSARAAMAVRRGELAALFTDLPAPHPALPERAGAPAPAASAPPARRDRDRDRSPAVHAATFALVMVLVIALPGILVGMAASGAGGGLLFLPLLFLLFGSAHHGRRRFGPGRHGHWHG